MNAEQGPEVEDGRERIEGEGVRREKEGETAQGAATRIIQRRAPKQP